MKVAELLTEGFLDALVIKVVRDLQKELNAKGANLAKVEATAGAGLNRFIRVAPNRLGGQLTKDAVRRVINDYLVKHFPEDNLMNVTAMVGTMKGVFVVHLTQGVNEGQLRPPTGSCFD